MTFKVEIINPVYKSADTYKKLNEKEKHLYQSLKQCFKHD